MSSLEQYTVTGVTKTPTVNPTQIRLAVSPKPFTTTHTPVSSITLCKGVPTDGGNRRGREDPKDIAAIVYLDTPTFNSACTTSFTYVNYSSTDVVGLPIESIEGFNF
jgi:hypothetical protein